MPIAKFITGSDIQRMHNEQNPDHKIGYHKACDIKKLCRKLYERDYGEVVLHNDNEIPLSWYEMYFGEDAFDPRKQKKKKMSDSGKSISDIQ